MFGMGDHDDTDGILVNRRGLLVGGLAMATTLLLPTWAEAALHKKGVKRQLSFRNIHSNEHTTITYFNDGHYSPKALKALNYALRDWRAKQARRMDPRLFDTLWLVQHRLGISAPFELICGYRSPRTNAYMHAHSDGVAQNSYHIRGMAADVSLPHVSTSRLRHAALDLRAGGVGYYPDSGFVHIDVGPVRHWEF